MDNQDLNTILGEAAPSDRELASDLQNTIDHINLLDYEENSSESKIQTPGELLQTYTDNSSKIHALQKDVDDFVNQHQEIFTQYQEILNKISELNLKQDELKKEMTTSMENSNVKNIANNIFKVTFVAATKKSTFDRKSFEAKYPVLCQQFLKYSDVSAYVKISEVK